MFPLFQVMPFVTICTNFKSLTKINKIIIIIKIVCIRIMWGRILCDNIKRIFSSDFIAWIIV